jgi:hypothetical protein
MHCVDDCVVDEPLLQPDPRRFVTFPIRSVCAFDRG